MRIYDKNNKEYLEDYEGQEFETEQDVLNFLQTMFFYDFDPDLSDKALDEMTLDDWRIEGQLIIK